ncbi:MAG TPA: TolC family protein [Synergistaceae bacterium]|nr:TolC family protein [Synergistaceae bacterium]
MQKLSKKFRKRFVKGANKKGSHFLAWIFAFTLTVSFSAPLFSSEQRENPGKTTCLSLEESIHQALRWHPEAQKARALIVVAQGDLSLAETGNEATLDLALSYNREKVPAQDNPGNAYDTGIILSKPIFDWGRTDAKTLIALESLAISRLQEYRTLESIVFEVEKAYYSLLRARWNAKVQEENLFRYEIYLGEARTSDKAALEVEASKARISLIQAEAAVEDGRGILYYSMGRPPSLSLEYTVEDVQEYEPIGISFTKAVDQAFLSRADLLEASRRILRTEEERTLIARENAPSLSVLGKYNIGGSSLHEEDSWRLGVELKIPLSDGGITAARLQKNRGHREAREAERKMLENHIVLRVKQALLALEEAQESLHVAESGKIQAETSLAQAHEKYREGTRSSLEVMDAMNALKDTALDFNRALHAYYTARAGLRYAMGQSLSMEMLGRITPEESGKTAE